MDAAKRIRDRMIDARGVERGMERIPVGRFVCEHLARLMYDACRDLDAVSLAHRDKRQGAATTLAQRNHDAALAVLVRSQAAINAVHRKVFLANGAPLIHAV